MFDKLPAEVRVTYIIKYATTYTKEDIIFEIDQDGKHTFYISPHSVGSVSCHFPKRVWDARFEVRETAVVDLNFKTHSDLSWITCGSEPDRV